MTGLLDLFSGNVDPSDPKAVAQARGMQGLLGLAAGFGQAAMPSRMPVPLGAAFGMGLQGQLAAQQQFDNAQKTRAETGLLGAQTTQAGLQGDLLKNQVQINQQMMPFVQQLLRGMNGAPGNAAGGAAANAAGTGAPSPTGGATLGAAPPNPAVFGSVMNVAKARDLSPVATTALVGAGLGEGGFAQPWAASGVPDQSSPMGTELSFGPWQLHKGGELDTYLAQGGKPGDVSGQTNYVLNRLEQIYPGFSQLTDPAKAAQVVKEFENGKAGADYYAAQFPGAADLISAFNRPTQPPQGAQSPIANVPPAGGAAPNAPQGLLSQAPASPVPGAPVAPQRPIGLLAAAGAPTASMGTPGPQQGPLAAPTQPQQSAPAPTSPLSGLLSSPAVGGAPQAPIAGNLAQGGGGLPLGLTPQQLASLGVASGFMGRPDLFKPLENLYYNSPAYKGQVAGSEAQAQVGPHVQEAWQKPMDVRTNGMVVNPATGQIVARNPALPEGAVPGGSAANPTVEMLPGAVDAIAAAERAKQAGKNTANYSAPVPSVPQGNGATPTSSGASTSNQLPGTPLAKNLVSTIPNYAEPVLSAEDLKAKIPEWTTEGRDMTSAIGMAQAAEHRLTNLADALKMTESGAFTTQKAELGAMLKGLGIDPSLVMQTDPAAVQMAIHENYRSTLQNLAAVNKRFSQSEFRITSENSEHPDLQPAANLNMLAEDIGTLRQIQAEGADWQTAQVAGKRNLDAFEANWLKANPLAKISDAVKAEIGPLKGMPGNNGTQAAASSTAPEGMIVVGPGGQRLQNRNGQWLDLQTLKPYAPQSPQAAQQ